ncbi:hypothetical protein BC567DRAFT_219286 [Phyllosticta citribraziliensis]
MVGRYVQQKEIMYTHIHTYSYQLYLYHFKSKYLLTAFYLFFLQQQRREKSFLLFPPSMTWRGAYSPTQTASYLHKQGSIGRRKREGEVRRAASALYGMYR